MWTSEFWKAVAERAIRTFAQAFVASVGVGVGLFELDWANVLSISTMAALLSVLTSIAANSVDSKTGASFGTEEVTPESKPVKVEETSIKKVVSGPAPVVVTPVEEEPESTFVDTDEVKLEDLNALAEEDDGPGEEVDEEDILQTPIPEYDDGESR